MNKIRFLLMPLLVSTAAYGQVGVNTQNPQGIFHIDAKKNTSATPAASELADDLIVTETGAVGIGALPDNSALLDLNVDALAANAKKAFLGPRVSLKSSTDAATINNPTTGLIVYNLGEEPTFPYVGFVYWNGSQWLAMDGKLLGDAQVGDLSCNLVTMAPNTYTAGVPYLGIMTIPYNGGNGGYFPAQTLTANGLAAVRTGGNLDLGAGNLVYTVSGTPTVTSPSSTLFNGIVVGNQKCSSVVGAGTDIKLNKPQTFTGEIPLAALQTGSGGAASSGNVSTRWISNYLPSLPVLGGKIRVDAYMSGTGSVSGTTSANITPRLYNMSATPEKLWISALSNVDTFSVGNGLLQPGGWVNLDNVIYLNYGENNTTTPQTANVDGGTTRGQELELVDLNIDSKWYRIYYLMFVDNKGTTSIADDTVVVNISVIRYF